MRLARMLSNSCTRATQSSFGTPPPPPPPIIAAICPAAGVVEITPASVNSCFISVHRCSHSKMLSDRASNSSSISLNSRSNGCTGASSSSFFRRSIFSMPTDTITALTMVSRYSTIALADSCVTFMAVPTENPDFPMSFSIFCATLVCCDASSTMLEIRPTSNSKSPNFVMIGCSSAALSLASSSVSPITENMFAISSSTGSTRPRAEVAEIYPFLSCSFSNFSALSASLPPAPPRAAASWASSSLTFSCKSSSTSLSPTAAASSSTA
mmetsp:Transcript_25182/g.55411  ORF Transcript_25182/g.55411 Transcript_25182/m.55411 type:complete len:268 (-) Transcript_25182:839-1642(-)